MYMDKLDRIDNDFFDRKAAEFRSRQAAVMRDIEAHQNGNQTYIEEGIRRLKLAQKAHVWFENQPPSEKRKLLDFVLSNCRWQGGELIAEYRQPFDMIAVAVAAERGASGGNGAESARNDIWLPTLDTFRTFAARLGGRFEPRQVLSYDRPRRKISRPIQAGRPGCSRTTWRQPPEADLP